MIPCVNEQNEGDASLKRIHIRHKHIRTMGSSDRWNVFNRRHLLSGSLWLQGHLTVKTLGELTVAIKCMLVRGVYNVEA